MKWTSLNDLRASFLSFFESKGHLCRGSYPLVPENDKSLLLIVAGMAPLKKIFHGRTYSSLPSNGNLSEVYPYK